ncbi:alpha-ketoglutarate-dependent dioxygenase AlkB family protein [Salinivibrio siamensis]
MARPPEQQSFFSDAAFDSHPITDMPDAQVDWWPKWLSVGCADTLFSTLLAQTPWQQLPISSFGRTVMQPRLLAWYGDHPYTYSGLTLQPLPWTHPLRQLKCWVEAQCQTPFNTVLLNRYRSGSDYMGWHRDDESELGEQPTIASVSLGASRRFLFRHPKRQEKREVLLNHGSLLVMRGTTQTHWQHSLPKTQKPTSERINLTFRFLTPSDK